jgi:hypothetical protein
VIKWAKDQINRMNGPVFYRYDHSGASKPEAENQQQAVSI